MHKKIAAVVVTFNRKELLCECLDAILGQTCGLDRIILIDNASTDGTEEHLRLRGYLDNAAIDYIPQTINTGGAGGFHVGIKQACESGFDWIWVMDDDVEPSNDALHRLLEAAELTRSRGFFCSRVLGLNGQSMNTPAIDTTPNINFYPDWDEKLHLGLAKVEHATFVSVLFKRDVINELGLPIKEMFIWGDDVEYTKRISKRYTSYLVANSIVTHKRKIQLPPSIETEMDQQRIKLFEYYYKNRLYVYRKYYNSRRTIRFVLSSLIKAFSLFSAPAKSRIIIKAILKGLIFDPEIAFPKDKDIK